ncbi:MAG: hypothetical protein HWD62_15630 [Cyclobacteriaceae bacterium]|nr:MAG: hypothetical protein HWD62_15630 [Cyclobacteriaceae bacterium]
MYLHIHETPRYYPAFAGCIFVIIGVYEIMTVGIGQAYTWVMVAVTLFLIYTYRKKVNKPTFFVTQIPDNQGIYYYFSLWRIEITP